MLKKRALAFMLSACMVATAIGGNVSAAELGTGTVSGNLPAGISTVSANDMDGSNSLLTVSSNNNKAADGVVDFEDEGIGNWGMTGDLAGSVNIADDGIGNKYLRLNAEKGSTKSAVKEFDVPAAMCSANVSFKWYTTSQTTDNRNGYSCIRLSDGEKELVSLYINDIRQSGNSSPLYYSVDGFKNKKETGKKVSYMGIFDVGINFDFKTHVVKILLGGEEVVSVPFNAAAYKLNKFSFVGEGTVSAKDTFSVDMGVDNFAFSYEEDTSVDKQAINALTALDDVILTKEEWEAGYQHPQVMEAVLVNDEKINVEIDSGSWSSEPEFDIDAKGNYTWTADIVAPKEHANPKKLKASYNMAYLGDNISLHDYENDFTFTVWDPIAWGKDYDQYSPTGGFSISQKQEENGNYYMQAEAGGNGDRGSLLLLNNQIIKGASVEFDWMPVSKNGKHCGDVLFSSPANKNSYFTVRFDGNWNIVAYTKSDLAVAIKQNEFEGSIASGTPISTGLSGQNKWFTIHVDFDYINHTADFTAFSKEDPNNVFTRKDIPIDPDANGLNVMLIRMKKASNSASLAMGIDNLTIDYHNFSETDITSVQQLKDVKVPKITFDQFAWPTEVTVGLGDGSSSTVGLGAWESEPAFNADVEGTYVWSADLVTGDLENPFNLKASFKMTYTMLPYPMYANNPNTLELEFGKELTQDVFPESAMVFLSDGTSGYMPVDSWTAIREFNQEEEGIYVYGANLVAEEGKTQIVDGAMTKNENHNGAEADIYKYDVYFRISYFKSQDNYNAYQRSMEYLDRGVYAINSDSGIFISWRLLVSEYGEDIGFNIYRNGVLVNETPVTTRTNYVDAEGKPGDVYTVAKVQAGIKTESEPCIAQEENYLSIPLQKPEPQASKQGELATYTINDAGVADVDGDGQYEIIVKWYPSNAFDSGKAEKTSSPTIFDVYEMDGTPLWRLNMGLEMPSGAHFNQFMLYDMDEDGKAELFIKTSDGTISYKPNAEGKFDMKDESTIVSYIGDKSVVPGTNVNSNGHVNKNSHEYVTVFNGQTGEEVDTINYVNTTGEFTDWGTTSSGGADGGNRSARYNIAIAYLPKTQDAGCKETIPAVLFNRGYYDKTTVAAYTLRGNGDGSKSIEMEWNFVTQNGTKYAGKGNHNMSTGDLDNDGFDELVIGALAIDHDGSVLWAKDGENGQDKAGHADSIHLAAMSPDTSQLYVFAPQEDTSSTLNCYLTNASNGSRIGGNWLVSRDIGRGVAANITPMPGFEYWAGIPNSEIPDQIPSGAIYNFYGDVVATEKPVNFTCNWRMYWDGDLLSELPDSHNPSVGEGTPTIFKYNWEENTMDPLVSFTGTKLNNSTKNNPSLTADLFGDWREEMVVRTEDNNELRIYMTTDETDYMIYTLMHDPVYRNGVANQNTSYNQPPHLGFYLGEDNADEVLAMSLPKANIAYTTAEQQGEVDKDALKEAVKEAEALNKSDYTSSTWTVLENALTDAKAELKSENSTTASVAEKLTALKSAIAALEKESGSEDPEPEITDKSKLQESVNKAGALDQSKYTEESYAAMKAKLDAALAVLGDGNASQEAVNKALKELDTAINGLVEAETKPSGDGSDNDNNSPDDSGNGSPTEGDSSNDENADSNRISPKTGQEGDDVLASPQNGGAVWYAVILTAAIVLLLSGGKFFMKAMKKDEEE